jgi:hypothetical protein
MLIVGTFQHSIELEQALALLEIRGVPWKRILVIAMDSVQHDPPEHLPVSRDRNSRRIELSIACATALSVIGASIGFILKWGPVIWGLISCVIGYIIGFGLYSLFMKNGNQHRVPKNLPEITVMVQCQKKDSAQVRDILWRYQALHSRLSPVNLHSRGIRAFRDVILLSGPTWCRIRAFRNVILLYGPTLAEIRAFRDVILLYGPSSGGIRAFRDVILLCGPTWCRIRAFRNVILLYGPTSGGIRAFRDIVPPKEGPYQSN